MHVISSPSVPCAHAVRETLSSGSKINVRGHVAHGSKKEFSVELLSGQHIVLHINFRFKDGNHSLVAMNSATNGRWGEEINHRNPLKHHEDFDLSIHVHTEYYTISVNGVHLADYPHRYPVGSVQAIGLKGNVHVDEISFTGFQFGVDWNAPHDYGHGGYFYYGTDSYNAPVFSKSHAYNDYF